YIVTTYIKTQQKIVDCPVMNKILYIPRKNNPAEDIKPLQEIHNLHPDKTIYYLYNENDIHTKEEINKAFFLNDYIHKFPYLKMQSKISFFLQLRKEKFCITVLGPPCKETGGEGGNQTTALLSGAEEIYAYNTYSTIEYVNKKNIVFSQVPARLGITRIYHKSLVIGTTLPGLHSYPALLRVILYPFLLVFYMVCLPLIYVIRFNILKYYRLGYYQILLPFVLYVVLYFSFLIHSYVKPHVKKDFAVIGIDAKKLGKSLSGVERAIENLCIYISGMKSTANLKFVVYSCNPVPSIPANKNMTVKICPNIAKLYWTIGKDLGQKSIDLFHVTWQEMFLYHSLPLKLANKSIYTIFDLINLTFPDYHSKLIRDRYRKLLKKSINWSSIIVVPSESTRNQVIHELDVSAEKLKIIYLGIDPCFRAVNHDEAKKYISHKFDLRNDFLLFIGRSYEHKNMIFLFEVFCSLVEKKKYPGDLVLIGEKYRYPVNIRIEQMVHETGLEKRFHWFEKVSDNDLVYFYNAAETFVFPSRYEGFGFPVLEAMACGTPVVASSATSLKEIIDDAAILLSPDDLEGFVDGIWKLHIDDKLRFQYVNRGFKRANIFDWNKTARQMIELYDSVISGTDNLSSQKK
ncbi:MAG: hypothetical protein A2161_14625, partial [Candidatus Schekmanbacteria bacterium RBG_13_48_7]